MSEVYIYDAILESHEAQEIAEESHFESDEEAAKFWFANVIYEGGGNFQPMPAYNRFVDTIDDEWDLYYDYGAGYYFAVNDNVKQ